MLDRGCWCSFVQCGRCRGESRGPLRLGTTGRSLANGIAVGLAVVGVGAGAVAAVADDEEEGMRNLTW